MTNITYPEVVRIETRLSGVVRLSRQLQHFNYVIHVVQVRYRVVDGADDFHGVCLQQLAITKIGCSLQMLDAGKQCPNVGIRLEHSAIVKMHANVTCRIYEFNS